MSATLRANALPDTALGLVAWFWFCTVASPSPTIPVTWEPAMASPDFATDDWVRITSLSPIWEALASPRRDVARGPASIVAALPAPTHPSVMPPQATPDLATALRLELVFCTVWLPSPTIPVTWEPATADPDSAT